MNKRRVYLPSDTHIALHPPGELISCWGCEVKFSPREQYLDSEDDPSLCLTCNRRSWSRLWNGNRPINNTIDTVTRHSAESTHDIAFDLSDSDTGEVVSINRGKR